MRNVVTFLLLFAATISMAVAQQTVQIQPESAGSSVSIDKLPMPADGEISAGASAVEQAYIWQTSILRRYDDTPRDTNRADFVIPRTFTSSGRQWRGIGQIFAPSVIYPYYYNPRIYNENSQILIPTRFPDGIFESDLEYVQQFKDAKAYIIDSLRIFVYRRSNAIPQNDGKITVFSTTTDFNGATYKKSGFHAPRASLQSRYTRTLTPEELDTTWQDINGGTIFARIERFAPDNPLVFGAGESAVVMYINDDAPSLTTFPPPDGSDVQQVWGTLEFRTGHQANSTTGEVNTMGDSLDAYKSLGVVMYRGAVNQQDTIHSAWTNLLSDNRPALLNLNMVVWGSVDLQSGVRYHFGADATSQGLEQATPNPVTTGEARLPFTLTASSNVTIDLFDAGGAHVAALVDGRYVPGRYSVAIPAEGLAGGLYLARMVAGGKIYTMTIAVSK
jgi:hypothetical protein